MAAGIQVELEHARAVDRIRVDPKLCPNQADGLCALPDNHAGKGDRLDQVGFSGSVGPEEEAAFSTRCPSRSMTWLLCRVCRPAAIEKDCISLNDKKFSTENLISIRSPPF